MPKKVKKPKKNNLESQKNLQKTEKEDNSKVEKETQKVIKKVEEKVEEPKYEALSLGTTLGTTVGRNKSGMDWKKGSTQMLTKRKTIKKQWDKRMEEKRKL